MHLALNSYLRLCEQLHIDTFLTDDQAARKTAQEHGYTAVGSVGIIAKCCLEQKIDLSQAETALLQLYETSTLFVAKAIVDNAIATLREYTLAH